MTPEARQYRNGEEELLYHLTKLVSFKKRRTENNGLKIPFLSVFTGYPSV